MAKQKVVLNLFLQNNKERAKALKCVTKLLGIVSVSADDDKIVVVGEGFDAVKLAKMLRKKMGSAELVMVTPEKEEKTVDDAKNMQPLVQPIYYFYPA